MCAIEQLRESTILTSTVTGEPTKVELLHCIYFLFLAFHILQGFVLLLSIFFLLFIFIQNVYFEKFSRLVRLFFSLAGLSTLATKKEKGSF